MGSGPKQDPRLVQPTVKIRRHLRHVVLSQAQQTIQEAEGYATEKVNIAKGDVARFLAVYNEFRKNPNLTRIRLYYEMFGEIFKKAEGTDLIDKKLKNFLPMKTLSKDKKGGDQ